MAEQEKNGVVDLVAEDEAEATALACKLLSYFQRSVSTFEVADQRVLRDVTWEIREGQILGVVGESGCGKSTQLRLLAGEISPHEIDGEIWIDSSGGGVAYIAHRPL